MIRSYKFRIYPSRKQIELLNHHLWLSKQLWNEQLALCNQFYKDFEQHPTKNTLQNLTKNYGMYAQVQQKISNKVFNSIIRVFKLKKKGIKIGFPRFKNFNRVKSLYYPQCGFVLQNKLIVTPFGEMQIKKHREIKEKIKTLTLKKEASGKWFAIFTSKIEKVELKTHSEKEVGIDLGLLKLATLSDGNIIENPRYFKELQNNLSFQQRKLSRKINKSKNFNKQKIKVSLIHEKIVNSRKDFLHKNTRTIINSYSMITLEDLQIQNMLKNHKLAKAISDVSWGEFIRMLCYKAEGTGSKVILVNPKNTSKQCSKCSSLKTKEELPLSNRIYCCTKCNLNIDRDLNAAINILNKHTVGQTGINASGIETQVSTKKEEYINHVKSQNDYC